MSLASSQQLQLEASTALKTLQNYSTLPDDVLGFVGKLRKESEPILNAASILLPTPADKIVSQILWIFNAAGSIQSNLYTLIYLLDYLIQILALFVTNYDAVQKSEELKKQLTKLNEQVVALMSMAERYSSEKGIRGFILRLIRMKKDSSELALVKRNLEQLLVVVDMTLGLETKADVERLLQFQQKLGESMVQLDTLVAELGGLEKLSEWTDEQFQQVLHLMEPQEALEFSLLKEINDTIRDGPHTLIDNPLVSDFWKTIAGGRFQMLYSEFWSALKQYYKDIPEVVQMVSDEVYRGQFQAALDDGIDFEYITVTEVNDAFKSSSTIGVKEVLYWLLGKAVVLRDKGEMAELTNCIELVGENRYRLRGLCTGDTFQKLLDHVPAGTEIDLGSYRVECCGDLVIKRAISITGKKAVIVCDQKGIQIHRTIHGIVKFEGVKIIFGQTQETTESMVRVLEGGTVEMKDCIFQGRHQEHEKAITSSSLLDPEHVNFNYVATTGLIVNQWATVKLTNTKIRDFQLGIYNEGLCYLNSSRVEFCQVGITTRQDDSNLSIQNLKVKKQVRFGLILNEGQVSISALNVLLDGQEGVGVEVGLGATVVFEGKASESSISGGQYCMVLKNKSEVVVKEKLTFLDRQKSAVLVKDNAEFSQLKGLVKFEGSGGKQIETTQHGASSVFE